MTETTPTPAPAMTPSALIKELQAKFAVFRDSLPLAIGIDKQIRELMPAVDKKTLRAALGMHANSFRYLKNMEKATTRFDLQGNSVGEITDEHRAHAKETLRERAKKSAERQKAEREAEAARQRTAAKLNQLAEKFSRR